MVKIVLKINPQNQTQYKQTHWLQMAYFRLQYSQINQSSWISWTFSFSLVVCWKWMPLKAPSNSNYSMILYHPKLTSGLWVSREKWQAWVNSLCISLIQIKCPYGWRKSTGCLYAASALLSGPETIDTEKQQLHSVLYWGVCTFFVLMFVNTPWHKG